MCYHNPDIWVWVSLRVWYRLQLSLEIIEVMTSYIKSTKLTSTKHRQNKNLRSPNTIESWHDAMSSIPRWMISSRRKGKDPTLNSHPFSHLRGVGRTTEWRSENRQESSATECLQNLPVSTIKALIDMFREARTTGEQTVCISTWIDHSLYFLETLAKH